MGQPIALNGMTTEEFQALTEISTLAQPLQALWHDARGEWDLAHAQAQADTGRDGAWVHAYLHRKEGDAANAAYWYARAGRPVFHGSPAREWATIATELLGR
jgi:hypothetical protein